MLTKIKAVLDNYQMITNGSPIVVGVSGGPDSMVLLEVLSQLVPNPLIAAHLNHLFRGEEAKKDAEFVRNECNKRGINAVIEEYDVTSYMSETRLGAQEAAREVRYRFYEKVANKWNAGYIALGHHLDDQAETVIMRMIRGTGIQGLSGIPYVRINEDHKIIRPLLDVTKEEIITYANEHLIPFRIDQSNLSTKYARNKMRLEVIPFLKNYNSNIPMHLHNLAKVAQSENDYLIKEANKSLEAIIIEKTNKNYKINNDQLRLIDIALQRRLIHLILSYLGLTDQVLFVHIEQILYLVAQNHPSKKIQLPGIVVYRNYHELVFTKELTYEKEAYKYSLPINGEVIIPAIHKKIRTLKTDQPQHYKGIWAVFDYQLLSECDLVVKTREAGDKIKSITGTKKIKDIFIDNKIPKEDRAVYPLICCNEHILWIPEIKKSNMGLVSEKTQEYIYIFVEDL